MPINYDLVVTHFTNKEDSVSAGVSLSYKAALYGEVLNLNIHIDKVEGKELSYYESTAIKKAGELLKEIAAEL